MAVRSGTRFAWRARIAGRTSSGRRIDFSSTLSGQCFFQMGSIGLLRASGEVMLTPARAGRTGGARSRFAHRNGRSIMSQHIVTELHDRVLRIELARPEKKNALTLEMYGALSDALGRAESDAQVRAVLIHGRPDCFSAGNDLADFLHPPEGGGEPAPLVFLARIAAAKKPLVAAVGGPAVGIGTTMLLHCDFVYAAPNTRFQLPFVPLGI